MASECEKQRPVLEGGPIDRQRSGNRGVTPTRSSGLLNQNGPESALLIISNIDANPQAGDRTKGAVWTSGGEETGGEDGIGSVRGAEPASASNEVVGSAGETRETAKTANDSCSAPAAKDEVDTHQGPTGKVGNEEHVRIGNVSPKRDDDQKIPDGDATVDQSRLMNTKNGKDKDTSSGQGQSSDPPSNDDDDAPSIPKPTKRRSYGIVRRSERCGKCDTCLNPHWKQACIEIRNKRTAAESVVKQSKSVAKSKNMSKITSESQIQNQSPDNKLQNQSDAPTTQKPSVDPFVANLDKILSKNGGVMRPEHAPMLLDLLKRTKSSWGRRLALAHVITSSIDDVKQFLVEQAGLLILQTWLTESTEKKDPKHTLAVLKVLDSLPVTLASLQPPCQLGKMVGKLRKATNFGDDVSSLSQSLVAKWKSIVQSSTFKPETVGSGKQEGKNSTEGPHKHLGALKKIGDEDLGSHHPQGSAPPPHQPSKNEGGEVRILGDGDIFSAAERSREHLSRSLQQQKTGTATTVEKPGVEKQDKPNVTRVSASPFDTRPSTTSISSINGGGNSLSSLSIGGYLHTMTPRERARLRAKEAAARVPSPPRVPDGERRVKRKKVSWAEDDKLVAVRWFRRDEEPAAAAKDWSPSRDARDAKDKDREEEERMVAEDKKGSRKRGRGHGDNGDDLRSHHDRPIFASAAKKEHLSEAEALRVHRIQEDKEREEFRRRLDQVVPEIEWYPPPDTAVTAHFAALEVAHGEGSTEVEEGGIRRSKVPPAYYTNPRSIPPSPADPPMGPDRGVFQPIHLLPRIPLTKEEAMLWSATAVPSTVPSTVPMLPPSRQQGAVHATVRPMLPQQQPEQKTQHVAGAATLPAGLTETIAQLAASGVLPPAHAPVMSLGQATQAQPVTRHPPPAHTHRPPLPKGLKPMLGLHRPGGGSEKPVVPMRSQAPCRYYNTAEGCRLGNSCRFAHVNRSVNEAGKRGLSDNRSGTVSKLRRTF